MEYYVLESLCRIGEYSLAEQRMCERYKEMIEEDYSTLWENWIKKDGTSNHAWSGGPLVIMSKHIAGIKPLTAGYEKFEVKPQYDLHETISCTVPAIIGDIKLEVTTKDGIRYINLDYPPKCEVKLYAPENAVITANGKELSAIN